jgi:5S rRNA maturation endonuclease (ribonuclease M5)
MPSRNWRKVFSAYLVREQSDGETKAFCPAHEKPRAGSKTASASFNFDKGVFHCFSRCGGMSIKDLYEAVRDDPDFVTGEEAPARPSSRRGNVRSINDAKSRGGKPVTPLPTEADVRKWHDRLMGSSVLLKPLHEKRGLNDDTLRRRMLGFDGDRYMIPVYDADGALVNVRRYKPESIRDKMLNWPGYGSANLYLVNNLAASDMVLLCEGELDALIGEQYGFATVTATAGAGTWQEQWSNAFTGKHVYIVYDNDPAGESGARKVATHLKKVAASVHVVKLPVASKQDLTDYFVAQGLGKADLKALMEATPEFGERKTVRVANKGEAVSVSVEESMNADNAGKLLEVMAMVGGRSQDIYQLPRKLDILCEPGRWGAKCKKCVNEDTGGMLSVEIRQDDPILIAMVERPTDESEALIRKENGVQRNCPYAEHHVDRWWTVEDLVLLPSVDDPGSEGNIQANRRAYNIGRHNTAVNQVHRFQGASVTNPRTGKSVFQTWECEPTKTSLDRFEMNPGIRRKLLAFQPKEGQSVIGKLKAIAKDISANVTHIHGRTDLHIAYDLVWHSLLDFPFMGKNVGKGWLEMLVMGDTRTGKSEAALRLTEHYQSGTLKSCEGATLAGLVGGAQQLGNNWVITWGTIPLQDRRLVVLDEVSGIKDKGILEQMSAVRSSGIAQITKVVSSQTKARTRLIWISNPVDGRPLATMSRGAIDAIEGLVPNPEDIARFDFAMAAASSDVDADSINTEAPPVVRHRYTRSKCSTLVTWAWSRTADQVLWEPGAEALVLQSAMALGARYVEEPPLVQAANVRIKLARLAVAVAARLFSSPDGEQLLVTREHVRAAVTVLDTLYGASTFGYAEHSREEISNREQAERNKRLVRRWLVAHEPVAKALFQVMSDTQFRVRDLEEFGALGRDQSQDAIGELLRLRMVRRSSRGYIRLQPELIDVLKRLRRDME